MGNNNRSMIVGRGDVALVTNAGCHLTLKDVRHVPDMRLNLISTGLLDEEGYTSIIGGRKWKLTRNSLVIARGSKRDNLYVTEAKVNNGYVNTVGDESSIELWHKRLGHMSEKGLHILTRREVLPGLKTKDVFHKPCTDCLAGKQHRASFHYNTPQRKPNKLDLIHSDVCGPMTTSTLGGKRYFVTFIDDHSRKVWAFAIKTEDQVFEVFKQFHASVERETGRKLKCIRTDNGGEYMGEFHRYCQRNGIRHERSVPKTPQHNGLAERMNRTIVERVRSMLSHAKLEKGFWGEALMTAVDLINLSPSGPLNGDVPNKFWKRRDVSYKHLKVFGCRAFIHIPKDERSKLDSKTKECIFLGYGDEEFGYRLWDPIKKKIIRSRDVVFFEDQTIEDIQRKVKPDSPKEYPVNLDPVIPSHTGGEDVEDDGGDPENQSPTHGEPTEETVEENDSGENNDDDEDHQPRLRRSGRLHIPSTRYPSDEYVLLTDGGEPETYEEALKDDNKKEWERAMQGENRWIVRGDRTRGRRKGSTHEITDDQREQAHMQLEKDAIGGLWQSENLERGRSLCDIHFPSFSLSWVCTILQKLINKILDK